MATPVPSAAYDAASAVLDDAAQLLAAAGRPVPGVAFVSPGRVAWDFCNLLAVSLGKIGKKAQGRPGAPGPVLWVATGELTLVRCVPSLTEGGEVQNASLLDQAAYGVHADGMVLVSGLSCGQEPCATAVVDGYRIEGPQGGAVAVVVPLELKLGWA